jgi:hypothetical protein
VAVGWPVYLAVAVGRTPTGTATVRVD